MPRLDQVLKLLDKTPTDPFLLYAAALEYKNAGDLGNALTYLEKTLAQDPNYLYAYYQQGQIFEQRGQPDDAKSAYQNGIPRARQQGDEKALSELQSALAVLD